MPEVKGIHSFVWLANEKDTWDSFVLLTNEREPNPFHCLSSPFFVILSADFGEVRPQSFIPSSLSVCSPHTEKENGRFKFPFWHCTSGTLLQANTIQSTMPSQDCWCFSAFESGKYLSTFGRWPKSRVKG